MTLILRGVPITKKNSLQIINVNGRPRIAQSKQFQQYEKDCLWQIPKNGKPIDYPVNVQCVYYVPDRRRRDLLNLMGATLDILVAGGVLLDDNCKIAVSHDGSYVDYDKDNPRVEITITERHQH